MSAANTIRFFVHCSGRIERTRAAGSPRAGCAFGTRAVTGLSIRQEKLLIASASESKVSKTVSSFVIDSRSSMRLVRLSSFSLPP